MKNIRINKLGLKASIYFIIISIVLRILLPIGDEPDFEVRYDGLMNQDFSYLNPYNLLSSLIKSLDYSQINLCEVDANAFSVWAFIEHITCTDSSNNILLRMIMLLFLISPVLALIIFRIKKDNNFNKKLDSISLSLIFPGMIYHLGVLAEEQLLLIITLLIFVFWEKWIIILLLTLFAYTIDNGNTIIILFFFALYVVLKSIRNPKYYYWLLVLIMAISLILGPRLLEVMPTTSLFESKVTLIYDSYLTGGEEYIKKYPVLLRPIITFMSSIIATPSGIKIVILYLLYGYLFTALAKKIYTRESKDSNEQNEKHAFTAALSTIFIFIFVLPTYANAKYYIFLLPFFIQPALSFFKKENITNLFAASSLITILHLVLFRI